MSQEHSRIEGLATDDVSIPEPAGKSVQMQFTKPADVSDVFEKISDLVAECMIRSSFPADQERLHTKIVQDVAAAIKTGLKTIASQVEEMITEKATNIAAERVFANAHGGLMEILTREVTPNIVDVVLERLGRDPIVASKKGASKEIDHSPRGKMLSSQNKEKLEQLVRANEEKEQRLRLVEKFMDAQTARFLSNKRIHDKLTAGVRSNRERIADLSSSISSLEDDMRGLATSNDVKVQVDNVNGKINEVDRYCCNQIEGFKTVQNRLNSSLEQISRQLHAVQKIQQLNADTYDELRKFIPQNSAMVAQISKNREEIMLLANEIVKVRIRALQFVSSHAILSPICTSCVFSVFVCSYMPVLPSLFVRASFAHFSCYDRMF